MYQRCMIIYICVEPVMIVEWLFGLDHLLPFYFLHFFMRCFSLEKTCLLYVLLLFVAFKLQCGYCNFVKMFSFVSWDQDFDDELRLFSCVIFFVFVWKTRSGSKQLPSLSLALTQYNHERRVPISHEVNCKLMILHECVARHISYHCIEG